MKRSVHGEPKGLRGGYRQRMAMEEDELAAAPAPEQGTPASSADGATHSQFAALLVRDVLWGRLPATKVAKYAKAAVADGITHPDLVTVSKLGGSGLHKNNTWRDLKRKLTKSRLHDAVGTCSAVAKDGEVDTTVIDIPILYPHKLLATMYHDYHDKFTEYILGGSLANIPAFWAEMGDHPSYASHPMHHHALSDFRTHAIPCRLYGDGTPATGVGKAWSKCVDSIIFSSCLVTTGCPWLICYIIAFIYELLMYKDEYGNHLTEDAVWREIVWSLYWAYMGEWPDRGPNNDLYTDPLNCGRAKTPLMGFLFIVIWVLQGDLDYMFKRLFLANYQGANPCSLCRCNSSDVPWTDHRDGLAQWQLQQWTAIAYAHAHPHRHRVLRHVPGVGIHSYVPDIMHSKHLGTDKSFVGSALRNLTHYILPHGPGRNLRDMWKSIKLEYKAQKTSTRFQYLTHNMIQGASKKVPELSGKAAQIRSLVPVLIKVWSDYMDVNNDQHRDVLTGLMCSARIDTILDEHRGKPRLPPAARKEFREVCFEFAAAQAALVDYYHPTTPLHNITTKTHYLMHIGMIASFLNPSQGACWMGEDMMRVSRRLLAASAHGSGPARTQQTGMERYCWALGFEMSFGGKWWA